MLGVASFLGIDPIQAIPADQIHFDLLSSCTVRAHPRDFQDVLDKVFEAW